jgi:AcrR family transcriptional regulator
MEAMPRLPDPSAHQALVESARAEFARRGIEGARVEDIARRAGVSKGAFYLHFRSKEAAFREILLRFLGVLEDHARARQEAERRFERELGGADGALQRAIDFECKVDTQLLELLWRNRQILAALDGASGRRFERLVSGFRRRMRALVAGRIGDRQLEGRLRRDVDPEVVADLVVGTYEDFGRRMMEMRGKPDLAAWARSFLAVLYQGVLERRGEASSDPPVNHPASPS